MSNISPDLKAKELVERFIEETNLFTGGVEQYHTRTHSARSAKICVEEILPCTWKLKTYKKRGYVFVDERTTTEYWEQVLKEIKQL